jgi:Ca-activated chloride channel family protein
MRRDEGRVQVQLANQDTIPNKDLILRYQVTGENTAATVLTQADDRGGHFASYLIPAVDYTPDQIVPKDVVFLVDTSGSQAGSPIDQSKELMRQFLNRLNADDTFTIINFSNTTTKLSNQPLANTEANRQKALAYINRLDADGGTELMNGINTVLNFPSPPADRLRSIVLLTDGLIGNDEMIIGEIRDRLKPGNRVYTFGVGSSTNQFLINRLAEVGRGTSEILAPSDTAAQVADEFAQDISKPVLTNVTVEWLGAGDAPQVYPLYLPDLFANQPLVLHGRKADGQSGQLKITGTVAGGDTYEQVLDVVFEPDRGNGAIAQLWGRARIKDLMNRLYNNESQDRIDAVVETALSYRLLSKYTAFVAVVEEIRTNPNDPTLQQRVPVENPEGMEHPQTSGELAAVQAYGVPEPRAIVTPVVGLLCLAWWFNRKRGSWQSEY